MLIVELKSSPTATTPAAQSSSSPKATARGRNHPTYYQSHSFNSV